MRERAHFVPIDGTTNILRFEGWFFYDRNVVYVRD